MTFLLFLAKLQPALTELARELHYWFKGDPKKAADALRRIRNWGAVLDAAQLANDERMAELRNELKR